MTHSILQEHDVKEHKHALKSERRARKAAESWLRAELRSRVGLFICGCIRDHTSQDALLRSRMHCIHHRATCVASAVCHLSSRRLCDRTCYISRSSHTVMLCACKGLVVL